MLTLRSQQMPSSRNPTSEKTLLPKKTLRTSVPAARLLAEGKLWVARVSSFQERGALLAPMCEALYASRPVEHTADRWISSTSAENGRDAQVLDERWCCSFCDRHCHPPATARASRIFCSKCFASALRLLALAFTLDIVFHSPH